MTPRLVVQLAGALAWETVFATGVVLPASTASASAAHMPSWSTRLLVEGPRQLEDLSCPTALRCVAVGGGAAVCSAAFSTIDGGTSWTGNLS
jgi:hypothetical protein